MAAAQMEVGNLCFVTTIDISTTRVPPPFNGCVRTGGAGRAEGRTVMAPSTDCTCSDAPWQTRNTKDTVGNPYFVTTHPYPPPPNGH